MSDSFSIFYWNCTVYWANSASWILIFMGDFSWSILLYKFAFNYKILFFYSEDTHVIEFFPPKHKQYSSLYYNFLIFVSFLQNVQYHLFILICWCCCLLSFHLILQVIFFMVPTWQILWKKENDISSWMLMIRIISCILSR